jgi:hypothetical protein
MFRNAICIPVTLPKLNSTSACRISSFISFHFLRLSCTPPSPTHTSLQRTLAVQRLDRIVRILVLQMIIIRRRAPDDLPRLVQRLAYLVRQRSLFQMFKVVLQLFLAGYANEDPIVTPPVGELELRVMDEPTEGDFDERQVVFFDDGLDELERVERGVFEVTLSVGQRRETDRSARRGRATDRRRHDKLDRPVHRTALGSIREPAFLGNLARLDLAAQYACGRLSINLNPVAPSLTCHNRRSSRRTKDEGRTSGDRVVDDVIQPKPSQRGDQLGFRHPRDRVVPDHINLV